MKIYRVIIEEAHVWSVNIHAESREEALDKANEIDLIEEPDTIQTTEIWIDD